MIISLIRTIVLYVVIILAIRLMGKRQISELQTSELVVTLLISDIAAIPMQNSGLPILSGLIPIGVLIACEILISVFMMKSRKFRKFICGNPIILINNGKIDQKKMKELRMSIEDLQEQLRQADVQSISDVAFAIVETNGKLSVLPKPEKQTVDASMLNLKLPKAMLETVIVRDGEFADFCMDYCNISQDWVHGVLKGQGLALKDVFVMTANKNKEFNIIKKEV